MKRFFAFLLLAAGVVCYAAVERQQATAAPQWELSLTASPSAYEGKCPTVIHLKGLIKLNSWQGPMPVTVNYSLLNNDGIDSFLMHGTIASVPGSLTITDARTPSASGMYWVQLHLHLGGPAADLYSDPARFVVKCVGAPVGVLPANPNATPTPCPPTAPCKTPTPCPVGVNCHPNASPTPCQPTAAGPPCPTPKPATTPCPPGVNCHPNATPTPCAFAPCKTPTPCPPNIAGVNCHPNATPTPCPSRAAGIPCTPQPCRDATGKPIPCRDLPDLTSGKEVIVGGAVGGGPLPSGVVGHHVPWGGSVVLSDKDAFLISNGRCAFNISYELANIGGGNAGPPQTFKDIIRAGAATVSIQSALTQAAHTSRSINTQAYLPAPGPYALSLTINDGHSITESNFLNNYFTIKYTLDTSKCMGQR